MRAPSCGDGAPEVDHRRGPAHDLLDRRRRPGRRSRPASGPCCSGCSVRASSPWEMALRVVSLPATTSRMKNDAISAGVRRLAVDLGGDQRGGEVVLRVLHPRLGQLGDEQAEVLRGGEERGHHAALGLVGHVLRVAEPEDHVGAVEDELLLAARDAHHVDDDPQRERGGDVGDEVALAALDDVVDDPGGGGLDVALHLVELPRGEPARHDPAHAGRASGRPC